jgi:homotetrameric cytidine deaminase
MNWQELHSRCYSPYSDRNDVCVALGKSGILYPGVRVENISFPLSIDSVQAALYSCLSEGDTPRELILPEDPGAIVDSEPELRFWCELFALEITRHGQPNGRHPAVFFQTSENRSGLQRLMELTERCIIPYSLFPVTALLTTDCGVFSGANIEVRDWQKGLCAERVAIAKARAAGAVSFREIHVYAPHSDYVSPCGACRQVLNELMADGAMYLHHNETETSRLTISDLLPYQFKAGRLGKRS